MDIRVHGPAPPTPFEEARKRFERSHDLEQPVDVRIEADSEARTWTGHYEDRHLLSIPNRLARSVMARELALHEFAHMRRAEESHPSHTVDTEEALFLSFAGREIESAALPHAYQIANHIRDIYADDITLSMTSGEKLAAFLESELAAAIADVPQSPPAVGYRLSGDADPGLTVVNAAFALALLDRHDVEADHRIDDLAHAAERDAPGVDLDGFRTTFRTLDDDPSERDCLRTFVDVFDTYFDSRASGDEQSAEAAVESSSGPTGGPSIGLPDGLSTEPPTGPSTGPSSGSD